MLKQLVEDVKNEAVRRSYLDKVGSVGQTDIEISLLGYPLISPEKIKGFLERNISVFVKSGDNATKYEDHLMSRSDFKGFKEWLGESIGILLRVTGKPDYGLCLREIPINNYSKLIPEYCLDKTIVADSTGFFDYFTVAYPEVAEFPKADPVIFGRRKNSPNRFYITQWDNDVTLDDLL